MVTVKKHGLFIDLQSNSVVGQTRLLRWFPPWLCIEYTRWMIAAIALGPWPQSIGLIGLGGGAQAHFCYRYFPKARICVVENDPKVLDLRRVFRLPPDNGRFRIELDDAAAWIRRQPGAFDLLLVDAYTAAGLAPQVATQPFYHDCRAALTPCGCVSFNFYAFPLAESIAHLDQIFAEQVLLLAPTRHDNSVVIASNQRLPHDIFQHVQLPWSARWQLRAAFRTLKQALSCHRACQMWRNKNGS